MRTTRAAAVLAVTLLVTGCATTISSSDLDTTIRDALGVTDYTEATDWGQYVTDVQVDDDTAIITLRVTVNDTNRDELGGRAARAISHMLPADALNPITSIVVQDVAGHVIVETAPAPLP